jgi:3-deoxy-7-phosphoheptulonate synthase
MIIVMHVAASQGEVGRVREVIETRSLKALVMPGGERVAIGIPSAIPPEEREGLAGQLGALPGVDHVAHVTRPYKLTSREFHRADTVVEIGDVRIGGHAVQVMAGPCAVESREQILASAHAARAAGATVLRGGAFKPRTSPYAFQGLQEEGLKLLHDAAREAGLLAVSEVMQPDLVGLVATHVDILQIGARNMQNYPLLIEAGRAGKPILLKRGPSASVDEFLLAAEYVLHNGNPNVMLCERGVHPLDRAYVRNTLDLNAVPVLKELTHLPVVVDPSHGIGVRRHVPAMAAAAVAAGADALIVEMHPDPARALSDGPQSLSPEELSDLMARLRTVANAVGRALEGPAR